MAVRSIDTACDFSLAGTNPQGLSPHNKNPDMQNSGGLTYNIWERGPKSPVNVQ
jgi:hypothetical protein